ncbi:HAD family phosphatase [Polaromonas sp.]|nr:HAD family phosphatase [Candidatus Saccharibacteria bacterium]
MAQVETRPFAVFDIDGTLIRWQLYHALADELARAGCLGAIEYQTVRDARLHWKKRSSHDAFESYERTLVNLIDAALSGISEEQFSAACTTVIEEYKDQVYTYTRDLIEKLRGDGYLLFAISASQDQIVRLLAAYYQFDDCGGSLYEVKDGYFTGNKDVLQRDRKPVLLKTLVNKHRASWKGSIAVGDSASDIPMLESVEQPIAFNPSRELFGYATERLWKIVVERKNTTYTLQPDGGKYFLAN